MTRRTERAACSEYANLSRRGFLRTAAAGAAVSSAMPRIAFSASRGSGGGTQRDVLISVFLRGGMDGLSAVVPYGDPDYASSRGPLAIPGPASGNGSVDLDGTFCLSPSAAPLHTPYADGRLLVVHAAGAPIHTLSHFDGMRRWETATPAGSALPLSEGWVSRHLDTINPLGAGTVRALSVSALLPWTLTGAPGAIPIAVPATYSFPGEAATAADRRQVLTDMYSPQPAPLGPAAISALDALDQVGGVQFFGYTPSNGAVYPAGPFGGGLRSVATMLKAGLDLECCVVDLDGWDHHVQMGPMNGTYAGMLDNFARSLEAFYLDLKNSGVRYTLVAHSEFGRRIAPNLSEGCDHGYGNAMFLMGDGIDGGRVLTQWPGMDPASLNEGDLDVTIDYRDVLAEVAERRLGSPDAGPLFPGHTAMHLGVTI